MVQVAAIIGGGVIGGGWAARFALMGWQVRVLDPDPEAERKIGEVLHNARRSLPGLADAALGDARSVVVGFGHWAGLRTTHYYWLLILINTRM